MSLRAMVASIIDTAVDRAFWRLRPQFKVHKDDDLLLHWLSQWVAPVGAPFVSDIGVV